MSERSSAWEFRAVVCRLFDERVSRTWDWSGQPGRLAHLRDIVAAVAAGHLDERELAPAIRRCVGNDNALATMTGQCQAVIRDARAEQAGGA